MINIRLLQIAMKTRNVSKMVSEMELIHTGETKGSQLKKIEGMIESLKTKEGRAMEKYKPIYRENITRLEWLMAKLKQQENMN